MEAETIKYVVFASILFYVPLWSQINLFLSSLGRSKRPVTIVSDKRISKILLEKTNTKLKSIKISESNLPFGMMIGIPFFPQLILSRAVYETFNENEIEYVVLHEAGHYNLGHSVKELVFGVMFFLIGLFLLNKTSS